MLHKTLKLFMLLSCLPLMAADGFMPNLPLEDFDREVDTTYVYLSGDCKKALLELEKSACAPLSADLQALCSAARTGQLVAAYDAVVPAVEEALKYASHQKCANLKEAANKLQAYKRALKSGDALVEFEDAELDTTKGNCCKSSKAFCKLFVRDILQVCGNLVVNGMTTLNALLVNNNVTVGGTVNAPAGVFGASSLIPFASGRYTIAGPTVDTAVSSPAEPVTNSENHLLANFTTSAIAVGFGDSAPIGFPPAVEAFNFDFGAFAFDVPADGLLHDLQVSLDAQFSDADSATKWFNYTLYISQCDGGASSSPSAYAQATEFGGLTPGASFTANILVTNPADTFASCLSDCSFNSNSVCVHKGDRVVLVVTMTTTENGSTLAPLGNLENLAVSAGILYTPTIVPCPRANADTAINCPS